MTEDDSAEIVTGLEVRSASAVERASVWFAENRTQLVGSAIVPELRRRFALTPLEAIEALRNSLR